MPDDPKHQPDNPDVDHLARTEDATADNTDADQAHQQTEQHTAPRSEQESTGKPATKRIMSSGDQTDLPTDLFVSAFAESKVPTQRLKAGKAPEKLAGQIAHFKVIEKLGSGGFGTVLRAYDTQLDREVAVKIIKHDGLQNQRLVKQFEDEAAPRHNYDTPTLCPSINQENTATIRHLSCLTSFAAQP